ncbi:MAG: 23S rRNA (adenine(2503)-C(2))-methyltransferase RlmN [Bacteroidales bacterium]
MTKPFIRSISKNELSQWLDLIGEKSFRAKQIQDWLWKKGVFEIDEMANLSASLRIKLKESFSWDRIRLLTFQKAADGTIKAAFKLHDKQVIEGVVIPSDKRFTACISTQVGCPVKCAFCATGQLGFMRNLSRGEIFDQVIDLNRLSYENFGHYLTNIVVMGMGEPLLNYDNTIKALQMVCSKDGLGWSAQRITLSTVGIPEGIKKLAHEKLKIQLAISLHSAIQEKRETLIPLAKKYQLDELLNALKYYTQKTQQQITFEYLMLKGINDQKEDAKALIRLASLINVKINLIRYNNVDAINYSSSDEEQLVFFKNLLVEKHLNVKVRQSRGKDIDAACGQLANKILKK